MSFDLKLDKVVHRYRELGDMLASGTTESKNLAKLSKEYSDLGPVVASIETLGRARAELAELEALRGGDDAEMRALAEQEYFALKARMPEMERDLQAMLLPKDAADEKNAILEVRAGTGGDEAGLFAAQLFRMYQRYAQLRGWRFEVMEFGETGLGGCREAIANVSGAGVFARLKFESGVHRVQRVPATEASGRIHTSTATVAVLPEAEDVDIDVKPEEIRIDTMRASGAGGQHVNKTESAIRLTHLETGIVVQCQSERSQHKNRSTARKMLASRLFDHLEKLQAEERSKIAGTKLKIDFGSQIRSYVTQPYRLVKDHRTAYEVGNVDAVLDGQIDGFMETYLLRGGDKLVAQSEDV